MGVMAADEQSGIDFVVILTLFGVVLLCVKLVQCGVGTI